MTLKPQSHDERKTTKCNSENLVVLKNARQNLAFFAPALGLDERATKPCFFAPALGLDSDLWLAPMHFYET